MSVGTQYAPQVGRPKKQPGEHYRTPARSYKPPPELYERVKRKAAANGETVTEILIRALEAYDRENG